MTAKNNIYILFIILAALAHLVSAKAGDAAEPYTMRSSIAIALKNNPLILSSGEVELSAGAHIDYQKTFFLPDLRFKIGTGYLDGESTSPFSTVSKVTEEGVKNNHVSRPYYNGSVLFSYPFYREGVLFGRGAPSVKKAEIQFEISRDATELVRATVIDGIVGAYLDILKTREDIRNQDEYLKYVQSGYDMAFAKYGLALLTRDEQANVEAELEKVRQDLATLRNNLLQEKITLAYWMGIDPSADFEISESVEEVFFMTSVPIGDIKALTEKAFGKNPLIAKAAKKVKEARNELALSKTLSSPTVTFSSDVSASDDYNPPVKHMVEASIELSVPIFDFGRVKYSLRTAQHKLNSAEMELQDVKNSVARDIGRKVLDIRSVENTLVAARKKIEAEEAAYNHVLEQYNQNTVTLTDVLEAGYKLSSVRKTLAGLNVDHMLHYAKLKGFIGELRAE